MTRPLLQQEATSSSSSSATNDDKKNYGSSSSEQKKDRAKARWSILRNALLRKAADEKYQEHNQKHSIHRFPGYQLLKPLPEDEVKASIKRIMDSSLQVFDYQKEVQESAAAGLSSTTTLVENSDTYDDEKKLKFWFLEKLEIAILALCAAHPKGCCLQVKNVPSTQVSEGDGYEDFWIEEIKIICQQQSDINVLVVNNGEKKKTKNDGSSDDDDSTSSVVLLVQEGKASKNYHCCQYQLDEQCSLWTREPRNDGNKLSLQDLITHRSNNGVDNTGNICIWDSERTLSYLLYNDYESLLEDKVDWWYRHSASVKSLEQLSSSSSSSSSQFRILELGTGMAGLAAITLGLRIVQLQRQQQRQKQQQSDPKLEKEIHVTLTDGHADGVKNNKVNQYLTRLYSQNFAFQDKEGDAKNHQHPYHQLDITSKVLLWTTDLLDGETATSTSFQYDIVLISDCVHFQNFHSALTITTLRSLKVGGKAIFCQPTRGSSLENFCALLQPVNRNDELIEQQGKAFKAAEKENYAIAVNDNGHDDKLVNMGFYQHSIIEEHHRKALNENNGDYDENLHYPKLLIVTKLRELTQQDCDRFISSQEQRSHDRHGS